MTRRWIYALHAPEVECIGKGKARTRYEFGVKTSITTTNERAKGGQFVLAAKALPGAPYDGHTRESLHRLLHRNCGWLIRDMQERTRRMYEQSGWSP